MSARPDSAKLKTQGLLWIALAYLAGAAIGVGTGIAAGYWMDDVQPLWVAVLADLAATLIVFGFGRALNNSSIFDPYWSIAPPLLGLYWAAAQPGRGNPVRRAVVLVLVGAWAARLTWNCLRGWGGLDDEDWRYRDLRARYPRTYWWISLAGLHLMPTVVVFIGCLSLYAALTAGARPLNWVDGAALLVTAGAIGLEARADAELWRFRATHRPGERLATGLWKVLRHPNYVGEMAFWWGLYLFALAANPGAWWTIVGPLSITGLFNLASIPMMERHMRDRRRE